MTVWQTRATPTAATPTRPSGLEALGAGSTLAQFTGGVQMLGGRGHMSYFELYRRQLWVNVCVNKIARGIARLPFKTYTYGENGDRERVRHTDEGGGARLAQLVRRPFPRGTSFQFWSAIVSSLYTYGRGMAWLDPGDVPAGPPVAMVPLDWRNVTVYMREGEVRFYRYRTGDVDQYLLPSEVAVWEYWQGVSPLDPLAVTLQLEDAGQRAAVASFENGVQPSGIVSVERQMNDAQFTAFEEKIRGKHGGVDKRFRLAVTDAAVAWTPLAHTAREAEMIEHRRLNREECAAAFDIDPTQVGILDRATYANVSEAHRRLYMDTLGVPIVMLEQAFDAQVVEPFQDVWGDVFVEFELDAMLRGSPEERSAAQQRWINSGIYAANEIRRMENLPRVEDPRADALLLPMNLEPVGPGVDEGAGLKRAADVSMAAQRFGLAFRNGIVSADEARKLLGIEGEAPEVSTAPVEGVTADEVASTELAAAVSPGAGINVWNGRNGNAGE